MSPQQATVPSRRMPQPWRLRTLTALAPAGGGNDTRSNPTRAETFRQQCPVGADPAAGIVAESDERPEPLGVPLFRPRAALRTVLVEAGSQQDVLAPPAATTAVGRIVRRWGPGGSRPDPFSAVNSAWVSCGWRGVTSAPPGVRRASSRLPSSGAPGCGPSRPAVAGPMGELVHFVVAPASTRAPTSTAPLSVRRARAHVHGAHHHRRHRPQFGGGPAAAAHTTIGLSASPGGHSQLVAVSAAANAMARYHRRRGVFLALRVGWWRVRGCDWFDLARRAGGPAAAAGSAVGVTPATAAGSGVAGSSAARLGFWWPRGFPGRDSGLLVDVASDWGWSCAAGLGVASSRWSCVVWSWCLMSGLLRQVMVACRPEGRHRRAISPPSPWRTRFGSCWRCCAARSRSRRFAPLVGL